MSTHRRDRADLICLISAEAISIIGSRMAFFAFPWLVLVTSGSAVKVGVVSAVETLAYVVSTVLAAPLQDRVGDRRTSVVSDMASLGVMSVIALFGQSDFGLLLLLVGITGVLRAQADRSKMTMIAPLMESVGKDYARVAAVREGVQKTSTLLGASLAGIVIVVFGVMGGIWINAISFGLAAVLTLAARSRRADKPQQTEPYFASLRQGFDQFRQDRLMRGVTGMLFFTNMFNQALGAIFVPMWIFTHMDDPTALGAVATAYAVGLIGGSVVVAWLAPILPRYPVLVAGYLLGGTPRLLVLALSDNLTLIVVVTVFGGIAMASVNPTVGAMIYQRTPKDMLARVGGIIGAVAFGGMPIGGILGGVLVETLGLADGVLIATGLYFMVTLIPVIRYQLWRELNDTAPPKPELLPATIGGALFGPRVTLRYERGEWTVRARRGWHSLLPATPVSPKTAANALATVDVEPLRAGLSDALSHDRRLTSARLREVRDHASRAEATLTEINFVLDRPLRSL